MATVTGLTAERMRQIEAASIVDGRIDEEGHLILTRYDETEIDAGDALVSVPPGDLVKKLDPVVLSEATPPTNYPEGVSFLQMNDTESTADWPTFAGMYGSLFSVSDGWDVTQTWRNLGGNTTVPAMWLRQGNGTTGWGPWRQMATKAYVDGRLQDQGTLALNNGSPITEYPLGISMKTMAGSSGPVWGSIPNTQFGTILTVNGGDLRSFQLMQVEDGYLHFRRYRGDQGGWRPWVKVLTEQQLLASNYTQNSALTAYPWGMSFLYMNSTESSSGLWSFSGKFGLVTTYRYSDDFAVQTWQKHSAGSTGRTELWQRTANNSSSWTPWQVISQDGPGWIAPTLLNGWVNFGSDYGPAQYRMRPGNVVELSGVIKSGTVDGSGNFPAFILPAGYRPFYHKMYAVLNGSNTSARIDVFPNGNVSVVVGSTGSENLDGITFTAEK